MKQLSDKWLALFSMAASGIVLAVILFLSEGFNGGGDSVIHYFLARFGFAYPQNFLNLWGRPFYTIATFPFAQLGIKGVMGLHIILALLTAWLAYLTMRLLQAKSTYLVPFFVIFIPVYLEAIFSAIPDTFFGFLLVFSVYLFFRKQYILSAVILSFLPFTRLEGMLLLPVTGVVFLLVRQWKSILFLTTGSLLFTFIGGLYFHDFLWIVHQFPYFTNHSVYSQFSGSIFRFIDAYPYVFGLPLSLLFIAGIVLVLISLLSRSSTRSSKGALFSFFLLIILPALIYFGLHTYLYWQGKGGSIGLVRVMAAIAPLIGMTAFWAYQSLVERFIVQLWLKIALHLVLLFMIIQASFLVYKFPVDQGIEEQLVCKATLWLEKTPYIDRKIFYTAPYVPYFLGMDPYDNKRGQILWNHHPEAPFLDETIPFSLGTIIFWDTHFGHHESRVPLDSLMKLSSLRLLNRFANTPPHRTMGGIPYEIYIFEKNPPGVTSNNYLIRDSLEQAPLSALLYKEIGHHGFEEPDGMISKEELADTQAFSGVQSCFLSEREYLNGINAPVQDFTIKRENLIVEITLELFPLVDFRKNKVKLVVSLENSSRSDFYWSHDFGENDAALNCWNSFHFRIQLPEIKTESDYLKVYLWNIGKQGLFVDDFRVGLYMPH